MDDIKLSPEDEKRMAEFAKFGLAVLMRVQKLLPWMPQEYCTQITTHLVNQLLGAFKDLPEDEHRYDAVAAFGNLLIPDSIAMFTADKMGVDVVHTTYLPSDQLELDDVGEVEPADGKSAAVKG